MTYSDNQISSCDLDLLLTTGTAPDPGHHHGDFFKEDFFLQSVEQDSTSIVEHHLKVKKEENYYGKQLNFRFLPFSVRENKKICNMNAR